ncbi:hypothetical protein BJX99DRAFT_229192 [Aspergillus californicus]
MLKRRVSQCEGTDDTEQPSPQKLCLRAAHPQNKSVYDILRQNSRERLYVRPILWTVRQRKLLLFEFIPGKGQLKEEDPPSKSVLRSLRDKSPFGHPTHAIFILPIPAFGNANKAHLSMLLKAYNLNKLVAGHLPFFFASQNATRVWVDGLFSYTDSINLPSLAHIRFETIKSLRKKTVYRGRSWKSNTPVRNRYSKQLRSLEPKSPLKDPYIVSILITLAQAQRRVLAGQESYLDKVTADAPMREQMEAEGLIDKPCIPKRTLVGKQATQGTPQAFNTIVLATDEKARYDLHVYTATIPVEFLERLDVPSRQSPCVRVPVKYFRVNIKGARKGLQALHQLLCASSCVLCTEEQAGDA